MNTKQWRGSTRMGNNPYVGFLYKKCTKIKPAVISQMQYVPEFIEAIQNYKGDIDDEVVFQLLSAVMRQMVAEGRGYRTAHGCMNAISRAVRGDSFAWK